MRKKNSLGFSLVETIIAMAIVAVVMSSTFYLIQSQSNNLVFSKEYFNKHNFNVNSYSQLYIFLLQAQIDVFHVVFSIVSKHHTSYSTSYHVYQ